MDYSEGNKNMRIEKIILIAFAVLSLASCVHNGIPRNEEHIKIEENYANGNYEEAVDLSIEYLKRDSNDLLSNHFLGLSLLALNKSDDAKKYFEKSIKLDEEKTWISGWSYIYLGDYYLQRENETDAIKMYEKAIELNKTRNSVSKAKKAIFNLEDFKSKFSSYQTEHINFYFEKVDNIDNVDDFIHKRENAFVNICSKLDVEPDFSIDFYVWDNREDVYDRYGVRLGFALSDRGIIHSVRNQTVGHEIAHTIVYRIYESKGLPVGLINEGIAVYFDHQTSYPFDQRINDIDLEIRTKIDIMEMWENWGGYQSQISYPISGAFVDYLVNRAGLDKMILLLENQSYSNGKNIYGPDLDLYIKDFERYIRSN